MLVIAYDWALVAASILVAVLAAFTGLRLSSGLAMLSPDLRKVQIAKSAIALGGGVWSMHFIGMLAVRVSVAIEYDVLFTLGSALVAILITGTALGFLHFGRRTKTRIVLAGGAMGLGVVSMHYIGMSAIRGNCIVSHQPMGIALSTVVGVLASIAALWLAYKKRRPRDLALGAVALGLSISMMHYTAMIHTRFEPTIEILVAPDPAFSTGLLAVAVAVSSFLICGFFLLTAIPIVPPPTAAADGRARGGEGDGRVEPLERLPYETKDATRFIALDDVLAIKAEGHYTRLFDCGGDHFCPMSISSIEHRLANPKFLKTHHSYLVNIAHVSGIQRIGDKASCLLDDEASSRVPVSRSRIHDVRRALGYG